MPESVLIIDDSPDIHDLLAVRLRPEALVLHNAQSGEAGLAAAATLQPDLILLDVEMPGLSGFDVCRRLKDDPATAAIPVIFLTAAADVETKVAGFDLGATDYVTKPFQVAELRARVRAALRTARYQKLLAARAQVDALTSLWNRAYFDRRLADEIAAAQRYRRAVTVMLLDLDHFKSMNDRFGHPFGDLVLQRLGDLLWAALRTADAPCRYGGEEFGIILTETSLEGAKEVATRIMTRLGGLELVQKGQKVPVTASIGISCTEQLPRPELISLESVVRLADDALYQAKHRGRNRFELAAAAVDAPVAGVIVSG
jgi:two-component system cell cycle response regulator